MQKKGPVSPTPGPSKATLSQSFNTASRPPSKAASRIVSSQSIKPAFNAAAARPVNKQKPAPQLVLNPPGMRANSPAQKMTMVEQKKRSAVRAAVNQAQAKQAARGQTMKQGLANTPSITPTFNRAARKP